MHLFMVVGIGDSGKSTLLKKMVELMPVLQVPPASVIKREIMGADPTRVMYSYRSADWSDLNQFITSQLNAIFYDQLAKRYSTTTAHAPIVVVENHLTYRHGDGFVRVVPDGVLRKLSGLILMTTEPHLALSRRGQVLNTKDESLVRECQDMEVAEASYAESGIGVPLLRLNQRVCEWGLGDVHNLPTMDELAITAVRFVTARVADNNDLLKAILK